MDKKPLGYLGGDIMSFGSNLARQYEYDKFNELGLDVEVYSPVKNKSINDKNSVTEEENNKLAEKITEADIERLWNSDFVVMSPEQSERIANKKDFLHYFDIRNTQLNEKGWRRSFSINQLLYGMVLYTAVNGDFESFGDIMTHLVELYGSKTNN